MVTILVIVIAVASFVAGLVLSPKATAEVEQLKVDLATAYADIKDLEMRLEDYLKPVPTPKPTNRKAK
jgi:hypothetical protein